jgi:hypothetical protein
VPKSCVVVAIARFRKHFPQRPAPLAGTERERERERDGDDDDDDDALLKENWKARSRTHSFFFFFLLTLTFLSLPFVCFWSPAAGSYHPFLIFWLSSFRIGFLFFLSVF